MNHSSEKFLARPCLSVNEYGHVGSRQSSCGLQRRLHRGMIADDAQLLDSHLQIDRTPLGSFHGSNPGANSRKVLCCEVDLADERPVLGDKTGGSHMENPGRDLAAGRQQHPAGVHLGRARRNGDREDPVSVALDDVADVPA